MILYMDTSSIAKMFIDEAGALETQRAVSDANALSSSVIAYIETRSLIARRKREKLLRTAEATRILDVFESDWRRFGKIPLDANLVASAGRTVEKHKLRTLDSIHLASALYLRAQADEPVLFLTADHRLAAATQRERFQQPSYRSLEKF